MKHLALFPIQFIFIVLFLSRDVIAENPPCAQLLHPLESAAEEVQGQGGIWGSFNKSYDEKNHATVTLKLDSKIMYLIVRLNHICDTKDGIPYDDIAEAIIPLIEELGEELFIEDMVNRGHSPVQAEKLIEYSKFAQKNLHRKLDFNQVKKTIEESQPYINRMMGLFQKIGKAQSNIILEEAKTLISDIEKFHTTNPYLKQSEYEDSQIPHSTYITGTSDAM